MRFEIIEHGGESYVAAVRLRDEILWHPAGAATTDEDIAAESALIHVAGFASGKLCATCLLASEGGPVRMKRVAVASTFQDEGIGSAMLRFCEEHARAMGASEIYAHARESAVRFYEKTGYVIEGESFEEDGIPHVVVRKKL